MRAAALTASLVLWGESGSPILLTKSGETWVIGLSTAAASTFEPGVGHRGRFVLGVFASALADRVETGAAPRAPSASITRRRA